MNSNQLFRNLFISALALIALVAVGSIALFSTNTATAQQGIQREGAFGEVLVQEDTSTEKEELDNRDWANKEGRGHCNGKGHYGKGNQAQAVADALGITVEELEAAKEAGTSMEDLAAQNGTTVEAIKTAMVDARVNALNQAVADGDLPQEKADWMLEKMELRQLMAQVIDKDAIMEAIAKTAGLTAEEFETARADGTLKAKIEASGVTREDLAQAKQTAVESMIDQAVTDGTITQGQADMMKENMNHRGRGHHKGFNKRDGQWEKPETTLDA